MDRCHSAAIIPLILLFSLTFLLLAAPVAQGSLANAYITQTGSTSGVCTAGVQNLAFFNNSANWGAGSTQIGPDTIVHLCGTFTGSAGANNFISIQGSGTSGHPITILWDTGAVVQAPYFGQVPGAINGNGNSWITLNGGTNGIIQNTANGTNLANHQKSYFIAGLGDNSIVTNLSLLNQYIYVAEAFGVGKDNHAIHQLGGNNITIGPNNTFTWSDVQVFYAWGSSNSNLRITGNTFSHVNQAIEMGPSSGSGTMTGLEIDHNTYNASRDWDNSGNNFHHNFFHPFVLAPGGAMAGNLALYDNRTIGDMGQHSTSLLAYIEVNNGGGGGTSGPWNIFNNLVEKTNTDEPTTSGILALFAGGGNIVNNTFRDAGFAGNNANKNAAIHLYAGNNWIIKNNIFSGSAFYHYNQGLSTNINNNDYFGSGDASSAFVWGNAQGSFATWKGSCGCDAASITTDPLLNSNLTVQAGSPTIGTGQNLSGLGITALNSDINGVARTVPWDMGAFRFGGGITPPPGPPPVLLSVVIQ